MTGSLESRRDKGDPNCLDFYVQDLMPFEEAPFVASTITTVPAITAILTVIATILRGVSAVLGSVTTVLGSVSTSLSVVTTVLTVGSTVLAVVVVVAGTTDSELETRSYVRNRRTRSRGK